MAELVILRPAKIENETSPREDGSNLGALCHVAAAAVAAATAAAAAAAADDDDDDVNKLE